MRSFQFARQLYGWLLLAAFSAIMFATLLYWWLTYRMALALFGPIFVAAGEPNTVVLVSELVILPTIAAWAAGEAVGTILRWKSCTALAARQTAVAGIEKELAN